jgi:hypothetical protein
MYLSQALDARDLANNMMGVTRSHVSEHLSLVADTEVSYPRHCPTWASQVLQKTRQQWTVVIRPISDARRS